MSDFSKAITAYSSQGIMDMRLAYGAAVENARQDDSAVISRKFY
jgi:hypothetical protein